MTPEEYKAAKSAMYQKYKAGEITNYAYIQWKKKNDPAMQGDPGQAAADQAADKIEKQIRKIYGQAQKEIQASLKQLEKEFGAKLKEKKALLASGEITQSQFDSWVNGYVMQKDVMRQKIDQCAAVMQHANEKAVAVLNGETMNVFAENANWQAYQITQDTGVDLSFAVYDEKTVERLIRDRPELLPRKTVNGRKDRAWNRTKIANAVTQSIIQGESIPDLARRVAAETGETNMNAMTRYARTAMTSAQNGGRMESLHRAQAMGINIKKKWLATLDNRTRDTHAKLDGMTAKVDDPFPSDLGPIMYPGDPSADPGNVYNCRCTLVYEYEDYPADPTNDMRRDNETGELIVNMNYQEWKAAKESSELNNLNAAKIALAEAVKALAAAGVDESQVYHNIWKDDVTLDDYPEKKKSIQAKKDYYTSEIGKLKTAQANGESWATDKKIREKESQLKLLEEYEKNGKLAEARKQAAERLKEVYGRIGAQGAEPAGKATPFGPEAYTQERKDRALWAGNARTADDHLRDRSGEVWRQASDAEKDAVFEYTRSYSKYNEPLRGIEYGTSRYLGVGNTDLNAGRANNGARLDSLTDILEKSTYGEDIWLQRGCAFDGMDKFFGCSDYLLRHGSQKELQDALLGITPTEYAFASCGSNKGAGLNTSGGVLLNIYCPKGTQMMYVEPFSYYGRDSHGSMNGMDGIHWDGKSKQPSFGHEVETLMQQNTQFRVTKVERRGVQVYVDMDVIAQNEPQRWKQK